MDGILARFTPVSYTHLLITGGTTGIALFVNDVFHTPVTVFVFVFNTIMFLIGFFAFGWKFAANTIVSTFSYPIALELITRLLGGYRITDDLILCTVFGGICIGEMCIRDRLYRS